MDADVEISWFGANLRVQINTASTIVRPIEKEHFEMKVHISVGRPHQIVLIQLFRLLQNKIEN